VKRIRDFGFVRRSAGHDRVASVSGADYLTGRLPRKSKDFAGFGRKSALDISRIAVIVFGDERRHSFRPSKAACLRVGARVVAIESDRFPTGR